MMFGRVPRNAALIASSVLASDTFGSRPFHSAAEVKASSGSSSTAMPHCASLPATAGSKISDQLSSAASSPRISRTFLTLMPMPVVPHR